MTFPKLTKNWGVATVSLDKILLFTDLNKENLVSSGTSIRTVIRGTQRQFSENICSEDDLRSRIFGTFAVKFLASGAPNEDIVQNHLT